MEDGEDNTTISILNLLSSILTSLRYTQRCRL